MNRDIQKHNFERYFIFCFAVFKYGFTFNTGVVCAVYCFNTALAQYVIFSAQLCQELFK